MVPARCAGEGGLLVESGDTTQPVDPRRDSPPAQGGVQILGTPAMADVLVMMHDKFQQLPIDRDVHFQFFDKVVDIPVVLQ